MEEQSSQKVFGGCEGPDAMYVKLISSDGHEFIGMYHTYVHFISTNKNKNNLKKKQQRKDHNAIDKLYVGADITRKQRVRDTSFVLSCHFHTLTHFGFENSISLFVYIFNNIVITNLNLSCVFVIFIFFFASRKKIINNCFFVVVVFLI